MGKASRRKRHRGQDLESTAFRLAERILAAHDSVSFRRPSDPPPTLPGLSDCLTELIAPFRDQAETIAEVRNLTGIAAFAWNLSLRPASGHGRFMEDAIRKGSITDVGPFRAIVSELVERKRHLFPDDTRRLTGFEVEARVDGFHLVVASAIHAGL